MAATTETTPLPLWARIIGIKPGRSREPYPWLARGVYWGGLVPLGYMAWRAQNQDLGANPISQILNELGMTALVFLVATLACTPARRLFGWTWQMRIRRRLGLFAFLYAMLHFLTYVTLDQYFDFGMIIADVVERPFITVGFLAFVLMIPMALTSTNDSVRRLGFKKWSRIHSAIYLVGILAALHFIWRVKIDISQPLTYAAVVGVLLAFRVGFWYRARARRKARVQAPARAVTTPSPNLPPQGGEGQATPAADLP
jgi:methionine sulfoxide reductase heme-binding subunit